MTSKFEDKELLKLIEVCHEFNRLIKQILHLITKKMPKDTNIACMKKKLTLLMNISEEDMILRCHEKLYEVKDKILANDEKFFMDGDTEKKVLYKYVKQDDNESYIKTMIKTLKLLYRQSSQEEKNIIWEKTNRMLALSLEYMILKGIYK